MTAGHQIAGIRERRTFRLRWYGALALSVLLLGAFAVGAWVLLTRGIGIWGLDIPNVWGLDIINYTWWIGISNACMLLAALLLLIGESWRNPRSRLVEAVALAATVAGALFPILHLGRPGLFYWNLPYAGTLGLWPQFRSPLVWDLFGIVSHLGYMLTFWYVGLLPELAELRDRARTRFGRVFFGTLALGWRGAATHWIRWKRAYVMIAATAIPLGVVVQTSVGFLFAASLQPGWNATILPVLLMASGLFSGLAAVTAMAVVLRSLFGLHGMLTRDHLDALAKLLLAAGLFTAYCYFAEAFHGWLSGDPAWQAHLVSRLVGPYAWQTWITLATNVAAIQLLWFRRARTSPWLLFAIAAAATAGVWFERYVLVLSAQSRGFLPPMWDVYLPTVADWLLFLGSVGLFAFWFLLGVRLLASVAESEERIEARHAA